MCPMFSLSIVMQVSLFRTLKVTPTVTSKTCRWWTARLPEVARAHCSLCLHAHCVCIPPGPLQRGVVAPDDVLITLSATFPVTLPHSCVVACFTTCPQTTSLISPCVASDISAGASSFMCRSLLHHLSPDDAAEYFAHKFGPS